MLTLLDNPFSFCSTILQTKWELLENSLSLSLSELISSPTIGWGTVVGNPISDNSQKPLLRPFVRLQVSLSLFVSWEKKIEFGNYLVELCKEFLVFSLVFSLTFSPLIFLRKDDSSYRRSQFHWLSHCGLASQWRP